MRWIGYLLIGIIIVHGCSAQRKSVTPDLSSITYRGLLEHNVAWQNSVKSLVAKTRITLDSPSYSGNFDAHILVDGRDSLMMIVTGPFGIRLGKVFIAKNRFLFYNQLMNQFYTGSKQDFEGQNFLQFPVQIGQIRDVFIAQDRFDILQKEVLEIKEEQYFLKAKNGTLNYNIWFDPSTHFISRIEYYKDDELLFFKEYKEFRKVNNIYFPHLINFVRPESQEGLSIYFTSLELNQPIEQDAFDVKISDSASQIDLSILNQ